MPLGSIQVCVNSSDPWAQERSAAPKPMDDMMACASRPMVERRPKPQPEQALKCPRCDSTNTKFCYYNNYSLSQPRYFCKNCRRYWTKGGALRNVPVGGGCRKNKRSKRSSMMDPTDHLDPKEASTSASPHASTVNHNNNPKELTNTCSPLTDRTCNILNVGFSGSLYNFGNDDINLAFARIQQAAARLGSSDHRNQPAFANCNSSGYLGMAPCSGQSTVMEGLPPTPSLPALNFVHSLKSNPFNSDALDFTPIPFRRINPDMHESSTPAAHVHGDLNMNSFIETRPRAQISEAAAGIHNFNAAPLTLSMDIHGINGIDISDTVTHWSTMHQKLPIESLPLERHWQELSEARTLTPMHPKSEVLTSPKESADDQSPRLMSSEWQRQPDISSDQTVFDTAGKDSMYWNINGGTWPDISATNYASPSTDHQQQRKQRQH